MEEEEEDDFLNFDDEGDFTFEDADKDESGSQIIKTLEGLSEEDIISNIDQYPIEYLENLVNKNTDSFKCLAQILISRSSLLRHILYPFPPLEDPGIDAAFNYVEPAPIPNNIGIELYKNLCKDYEIVAYTRVIQALPTNTLNLKFYCLTEKQVKALATTLSINKYVQNLILQDNWLSPDGAFQIGEMLTKNDTIKNLSLRECRIGSEGARAIAEGLNSNQTLREIDFSHNDLTDEDVDVIVKSLYDNMSLKKLNFSHNHIQDKGVKSIGSYVADSWLENLDLSWNELSSAEGLKFFVKGLLENNTLKNLNLSWNSLNNNPALTQIAKYIKNTTSLKQFDISSNRITGSGMKIIKAALNKNQTISEVFLGFNPISPADAYELLKLFLVPGKPLRKMDLENVFVDKHFADAAKILKKRGRDIKVQGILNNYVIKGPDVRKVLFERIRFISTKAKKKKDFGHFVWGLTDTCVEKKQLHKMIRKFKIKIDPDCSGMLASQFLKDGKVNLGEMKKVYLEMYPETTAPPPKKKKKKKKKSVPDSTKEVQTDTTLNARENINLDQNFEPISMSGEKDFAEKKSTGRSSDPRKSVRLSSNKSLEKVT